MKNHHFKIGWQLAECPNCGFDLNGTFNISSKIQMLFNKRSTRARESIKTIIRLTKQTFPVRPKDVYHFLLRIKDVPDNIIVFTINRYFKQKHYESKPINYLAAIIKNHNENLDKLREVERKRFGSKPPTREI